VAREILFLVEDADEGGYVARALGHSILTEADSWDELKRAIRDAVQCHFDEGVEESIGLVGVAGGPQERINRNSLPAEEVETVRVTRTVSPGDG